MRSILASAIKISPTRQRREFKPEAIAELAQSIQSKGLMHPPVLREEAGEFILVAGERRLRAMSFLWMTGENVKCDGVHYDAETIPYVLLSDLDALAFEEAELEENIRRVDLTWQERAAATKRLHDLRQKQAPAGVKQSINHTAKELDRPHLEVTAEVLLAGQLHRPEIAKAKNAKEGLKILKRMETSQKNADLAALIGDSMTSSSHTLVQAEAGEWLTAAADAQFDVILSDPPYGMGADEFGDAGGSLAGQEHAYKDDYAYWTNLMKGVMPHLFRVAKAQAHLYLFCDIDRFHELRAIAAEAGWRVHRTPIIWAKPSAHRVPWPEHGPRRQWEMILYAVKGNRRVNKIASDCIEVAGEENLGHAAQKPAALFADLLARSVVPGDTVLDFCCGTGPIFPAAHGLKCKAVGVEREASTFAIAAKRLEGVK